MKWLFILIVVLVCILFYTAVKNDVSQVGEKFGSPIETAGRWKRSVLGQEQKPLSGTELEIATLSISAGVAIDSEGETAFPEALAEVQERMIDAHLRYKSNHQKLGYQEIVETSKLWLPDDWTYPLRWRNRPIATIASGRETTIKRLKPIVEAKLKESTVPPGCADRYVRPDWHLGGFTSGESFAPFNGGSAISRVRKLIPDPDSKDKGYNTEFYCSRR